MTTMLERNPMRAFAGSHNSAIQTEHAFELGSRYDVRKSRETEIGYSAKSAPGLSHGYSHS
jgi:hypothetical protein